MHASLRAFMAHLIDYAGLFPPASLQLAPAFEQFAAYRAGPDAWMLGRFICPAIRLPDSSLLIASLGAGNPLSLAALGRKSADEASFAQGLAADLQLIEAARARHPESLRIDVLELPLPPGPVAPALLAELAERAASAGLRVFCELSAPLDGAWISATRQLVAALANHNAAGGPPLGFKLRTGGVTADAIPTLDQVAEALVAARDAGLPLKCTAGLHHPFRQHRPEVAAPMHGFVNVFAAGMLAHLHGLDAAAVGAILADERPAAFQFGDGGLAWGALLAPTAAIARLRQSAMLAFGSCSFDEPRDDLRALGLLP